jgi:hypothetical protein
MTIVPLILEGDEADFISIKEAELQNASHISEQESASVNELEVINSSNIPILIPFGHTISGGKQDRVIYQPLLVPPTQKGKPIPIPSRCVEAGRWSFELQNSTEIEPKEAEHRKFKSAKIRLNPSIMSNAMKEIDSQGSIWGGIEAQMGVFGQTAEQNVTRSYNKLASDQKGRVEKYTLHFKDVERQCGVAVFINEQLTALEFYGNAKSWKDVRNETLNGFTMEAILRMEKEEPKDVLKSNEDYWKKVSDAFAKAKMTFEEEKQEVGLGSVIKFGSEDGWSGITLIHQGKILQFYATAKSVLPETDKSRMQVQEFRNVEIDLDEQRFQSNREDLDDLYR